MHSQPANVSCISLEYIWPYSTAWYSTVQMYSNSRALHRASLNSSHEDPKHSTLDNPLAMLHVPVSGVSRTSEMVGSYACAPFMSTLSAPLHASMPLLLVNTFCYRQYKLQQNNAAEYLSNSHQTYIQGTNSLKLSHRVQIALTALKQCS